MQQAVSETTNELLKRNAALLKQNSHETAVENERAIVDIETIKQVNEDLIATIEILSVSRVKDAKNAKLRNRNCCRLKVSSKTHCLRVRGGWKNKNSCFNHQID